MRIAEHRERALRALISQLHLILDNLRDDEPPCSFECSSILLGALSRQMNDKRLLRPRPVAPFLGHSVNELIRTMRRFRSPNWVLWKQECVAPSDPLGSVSSSSQNRCNCRLSSLTAPRINEVSRGIKGLELLEFRRSNVHVATNKSSQ